MKPKRTTKNRSRLGALLLLVLSIGIITQSCVSHKKVIYFQEMEAAEVNVEINNVEPVLTVGDLLTINVSAIDAEAAIPFNLYETASTTNPKPLNYLVDAEGNINFPVLGTMQIAGLTTKALTEKLTVDLEPYLKKPIINIRLTNFKVTILGEVKNPGAFTIANERITILEAIGLAGDLTIQGKRQNVVLVREKEGKRVFVNIDLTNKLLFNSPYYYLSQNDVLYIEPNKTKINSSGVGATTSVIFSSISVLISLITLLTI